MQFYGIGYREMLSLPVRFFWTLYSNIDRIQAHADLRQMTLINLAFNGGEEAVKYRKSLILEIGDVQKVKHDPMQAKFDKTEFDKLKNSIRRQNNKNK